MKNLNKVASLLTVATMGLVSMTGCEGGDIYTIDSPDWLASRIDSVANANQGSGDDEIEGLQEDYYTIGKTDYTSGWWANFSKYYVVPDGQKWQAQFNLNINPDDNTYYKNFALIVATNTRDGEGYSEYGAFRYDLTGDANAYNSNWGTEFGIIENGGFKYTSSTMLFAPVDNKDAGLQKMNGKVTLTVDRTGDGFYMEISNGTIIKTFNKPEELGGAEGNDVYCFLVPEGSFIDFLGTTIVPIGGLTSKEDKQPLSMTLKGVPGKVLQGTPLDSAMASVTAVVQFEQEVTKEVPASELTFDVIPDMNDLGTKTLIAVYNKTFKGEATSPVIGKATFQVVDKLYTTIGESSCTTSFWGAHSANIKVERGETYVTTFTNYSSGVSNWNNFVIVLDSEDTATEYAVVRADNYGWGSGYAACTPSRTDCEWATWLAAMDGAKVTAFITNRDADKKADVKCVIIGNDGETYYQDYIGIDVTDPDNLFFNLTVDNSCIVFDYVVGNEDNSSSFWGAHSDNLQVEPGQTLTQSFVNYTCGTSNWNNFCVVLNSEDTTTEYAVVRSDNYGWGSGYAACTNSGGQQNWTSWLAAMDGAVVTVSVTNNGDGTADVKCIMIGNDGETYYQDYIGINTVDPDNCYMRLTVDNCHMTWDNVVAR